MRSLLAAYDRLAARLYPVRALFWLVAAASLAGFAVTLFVRPSADDTAWMFLALVLLTWSVLALVFVHAFLHPAPAAAADAPVLARLRAWLARAGRVLLALLVTGLLVAALLLSFKAVGVLTRVLGD